MKGKICIVGHPSKLGGADTELDHQIRVWQALGIEVHICHTGKLDKNLKAMKMAERGCIMHECKDWKSLKDLDVIGYCNAPYLTNMAEIKKYAASSTFVNCMTWLFPKEKQACQQGLIDHFIYQTNRVKKRNFPILNKLNEKCDAFVITPYFDTSYFKFYHERDASAFRFGRIHREDGGKFHPKTKWIYDTMVSPVEKRGIILGFNDRIEKRTGKFPDWIKSHRAGGITQTEFYRHTEAIIQPCDPGHTENLPRIAFEAMASGTILIVDNKGGWPNIIDHGKTGWLCSNEREFVYYASRCAYEREERQDMCNNAHQKLIETWGLEAGMKQWSPYFEKLGVL